MSRGRQNIPHFARRITEFISKTRGISFAEAAAVYRNREYTRAEYAAFIAKATEVTREEQLRAGIKLMEQKENEDRRSAAGVPFPVPGKGMPKISRQLAVNIGKASLCKTETAVLVELARCQDPRATVIMTVRALSERTGYSRTMVLNALNGLREYGLISMEGIGGWRYRIRINGNDFEHRYRFRQGYIPANMRIFREERFRKATAAEQYLLLLIMFRTGLKEYRDEMKKDPSSADETVTVCLPFEELRDEFNRTSYYSGFAFTKTVARLKRDFGARKVGSCRYMETRRDGDPFCPEGRHMLVIGFRKGLFAVEGGSDNFIWKKHMLELVAEKQGIHLTEEELDEAAKVFPRTDGSMEDILSMGAEYLDRIKTAPAGGRADGEEKQYDLGIEESESFLTRAGDLVSRKSGVNSATGTIRKRRLTDPLLTTDRYLSSGDRIVTAVVVTELFREKFTALKKGAARSLAAAADNAVQAVFRMFDPQGRFWRDRVPAACTA